MLLRQFAEADESIYCATLSCTVIVMDIARLADDAHRSKNGAYSTEFVTQWTAATRLQLDKVTTC